tara:strand:- start:5387 stop:5626 length:240 start_codon:yes stop_codon:yes gene_type:complete
MRYDLKVGFGNRQAMFEKTGCNFITAKLYMQYGRQMIRTRMIPLKRSGRIIIVQTIKTGNSVTTSYGWVAVSDSTIKPL